MTTERYYIATSASLTSEVVDCGFSVATDGRAAPSRRYGSQAGFWTTDWQRAEQRASIDILIGDTHPVRGAQELLDWLHS